MKSSAVICALLVAFCSASVSAQSGDRCEGVGGVAYDDGEYESSVQCVGSDCRLIQKLWPDSYPKLLKKVCLCWFSEGATGMNYDLEIYDDNGLAGEPGTRLVSLPKSVSGVSGDGKYVSQDCTDLNLSVPNGGIYVGAHWATGSVPGRDFYVCTDFSTSTRFAWAYYKVDYGPWTFFPAAGTGARALGVRAEFEEPFEPGDPCVESDTSLCLSNNRFQVNVSWTNFQGATGVGHKANLSDTSGTFWFFAADNVEFLVKIVDGCSFNERFWFFAAATTNVQYEVTVTDTYARRSKTYRNDLGVASPAITDIGAFATCDL